MINSLSNVCEHPCIKYTTLICDPQCSDRVSHMLLLVSFETCEKDQGCEACLQQHA